MRATSALDQIGVLGMHYAEMTSERIVSAERLFLGAQRAVHLELARVVNCVLMSGEIVRPRENGIARFSGRWVDSLALGSSQHM